MAALLFPSKFTATSPAIATSRVASPACWATTCSLISNVLIAPLASVSFGGARTFLCPPRCRDYLYIPLGRKSRLRPSLFQPPDHFRRQRSLAQHELDLRGLGRPARTGPMSGASVGPPPKRPLGLVADLCVVRISWVFFRIRRPVQACYILWGGAMAWNLRNRQPGSHFRQRWR